jgi:hypothetical protein
MVKDEYGTPDPSEGGFSEIVFEVLRVVWKPRQPIGRISERCGGLELDKWFLETKTDAKRRLSAELTARCGLAAMSGKERDT